jgi:subtilisin family serine protease
MSPSSILLRTLALSALAVACHSALAADIDASVVAAARDGGRVETLIVLADQARPALAPLSTDADYRVRRRALVDALQARAAAQQADLRDWLDARGIEYRPYWIANVVWARLSTADLQQLAARSGIARIAANPEISLQLPQQSTDIDAPAAPDAIEWGVNKINAPLVWADGFNGQGVVIAGQDTGYQWDHPALKAHYRGWDGATADHNYSWHDSIHAGAGGSCSNDSPVPCDGHGHGTHTAGTFAGGDGGANQIGVAPGARWIGCRNMTPIGAGTPATYIECMEWFLAPTDQAGQNPDPDLAPDIINNSWGCPPDEGCTVGDELADAVGNLVEAGIVFVASAGNDGSSCSSVLSPPAIYDASFVVGMTNVNDALDFDSSRGPVGGAASIRPDVSAPGVGIRSSVPGSSYGSMTGTSMAGPHVAGAAALLMSVNPALKGHPDQIAQLLRETAAHTVTDPWNSGCGGLTIADWPNYQAGHGRIDAYAAAIAADTIFEDGFDGAGGN